MEVEKKEEEALEEGKWRREKDKMKRKEVKHEL